MKPNLPKIEERWSERMQRALHAELERVLSALNPFRQIPPGGGADQILSKASGKDYDVQWVDSGLDESTVDVTGTPTSGQYARFTDANTLAGVSAATVKSDLSLVKGDVGLGNVDNTSDANKPVSTAQAAALKLKASNAKAYFLSR